MSGAPDPIVIRLARPTDATELRRLAQRDSADPPPSPALVAEVGGRIRAALGLDGETTIADPFESTAAVVELLRLRAAQLRVTPRPTRSWRQALTDGRGRHHSPHRPAAARMA
jgi:hypothetical protein